MGELITCLHGFLGSPRDFDFLRKEYEVYTPDLDNFVHKNLRELQDDLAISNPVESNILIGYSFGARIALGLFLRNPHSFNKMILLGGHGGLTSEEERTQRLNLEESFCSKLDQYNFDEFLSFWNGLELFHSDSPVTPAAKDLSLLKNYFVNFGLSKQPFYLNQLKEHQDKVLWIFGENDKKYVSYANENLGDFNVRYVSNCGHRVLHSPAAQNLIKKELTDA